MIKLMDIFKSKGYPEKFIYKCVKTFLVKKHGIPEKNDNCA